MLCTFTPQVRYSPRLRTTVAGWSLMAVAYYAAAVKYGDDEECWLGMLRYWVGMAARYVLLPSAIAVGCECLVAWGF